MSVGVDPLPSAFHATALYNYLGKIDTTKKTKKALYDVMLPLLLAGDPKNVALRNMRAVVYGIQWRWPEAEAFLQSQGVDGSEDDVLKFLLDRVMFYAHHLYRRGQIRSLISCDLGHRISVRLWFGEVDIGKASPCGRFDGDVLEPTPESLKTMPPCSDINCCCSWTLFRP